MNLVRHHSNNTQETSDRKVDSGLGRCSDCREIDRQSLTCLTSCPAIQTPRFLFLTYRYPALESASCSISEIMHADKYPSERSSGRMTPKIRRIAGTWPAGF